jgi:hypothetical protein
MGTFSPRLGLCGMTLSGVALNIASALFLPRGSHFLGLVYRLVENNFFILKKEEKDERASARKFSVGIEWQRCLLNIIGRLRAN